MFRCYSESHRFVKVSATGKFRRHTQLVVFAMARHPTCYCEQCLLSYGLLCYYDSTRVSIFTWVKPGKGLGLRQSTIAVESTCNGENTIWNGNLRIPGPSLDDFIVYSVYLCDTFLPIGWISEFQMKYSMKKKYLIFSLSLLSAYSKAKKTQKTMNMH